ncbi:MAG TPA: redoxin domain-containing protein [Candidatus Hydrogenedentes bacterium]|nr:redoxin domain-containing protein [Candidatus Hydrogenedentota bacterium]HQM48112.1 redoxin domain-containing protein [Candidatus Hydrogenedentota bacterium]
MGNMLVLGAVAILVCTGLSLQVLAGEVETAGDSAKEEALRVGDVAPNVKLVATNTEGEKNQVELKSFQGKKNVLLAFYPRTFTAGCTKQMCGYRDDFSRFKDADTEVFAISVEPQDSSDRFKKEYQLPFNVVGDGERRIVKAFKVPVRDQDGNGYAKRSVFLIDKKGIIRHIDMDYDIEKDKQDVYERIAALNKSEES